MESLSDNATNATAMTVRGPVPAGELGSVLMHEHVFVLSPEIRAALPGAPGDDELVDHAVAWLARAREAGVDTVLDATILGQGRDGALLRRVADRTPVHLVASTGVFVREELPRWFAQRRPAGAGAADPLAEWFVRELTDGIGTTGVRAGVVKCAAERLDPGADCVRAARAAGRAAVETGVAVITHSDANARSGLALAQLLAEEGVDPWRVVIGHSGDTDDLAYLRSLLDRGFVLGMDRFNYDHLLPHATRVRVLAELCRLGYAGQLVLSHDCPAYIDHFEDRPGAGPFADGLTRVHRRVVAELRTAGVDDTQLNAMLVDNPRRLLARPC